MNTSPSLAKPPTSVRTPERVSEQVTVAPFVDVYENKDELLIVADVPGATKEGVTVNFDKGQLTIEARRADAHRGTSVLAEYRPRDYYRAFTVPQGIDASRIDAQLSAGVLRLRLPKSDAAKPRRIEVKTG
jgi:HSP20 family molecular chaperone IbpA